MANKYDGYIYDSCSWGFTISWNNGEHEDFMNNEFRGNEDFEDFMYHNNLAYNYEEYKKGEIEES